MDILELGYISMNYDGYLEIRMNIQELGWISRNQYRYLGAWMDIQELGWIYRNQDGYFGITDGHHMTPDILPEPRKPGGLVTLLNP